MGFIRPGDGSGDLLAANNLSDVASSATSRSNLGAAASGANTDLTSIYLNNTGLKVKDTNASHGLIIKPGSDLTADKTLTLVTGDADVSVTLATGASLSGSNTGDNAANSSSAAAASFIAGAGALTGPAAPLTIGTAAASAVGDFAAASSFIAGAGALTGPAAPLTIGTAAGSATTAFATAAQGTTADTAVQPSTSPLLTSIELGHATDTTITRTGAGAIAVEGVAVLLSGGALGTPASGTMTNVTGVPVAALAAGTAGNLITWSAAGAAAVVATGTAAQVLTSNGAGLAPTFQAAAGGVSWGNSASGTTADGLTLTLSNSSADGAAALKLIAGNTQASQPVLANLQLGTSGQVMGLLIQGTGAFSAVGGGAAGTGDTHLCLWANTANSTVNVISIGSDASYSPHLSINAQGQIEMMRNTAGAFTGAEDLIGIYASAGSMNGLAWNGRIINFPTVAQSGASWADRTNPLFTFNWKQTDSRTSGTTTFNYNHMNVYRFSGASGAGGTVNSQGTVIYAENGSTGGAATFTDTVNVLKLVQAGASTGLPLAITQNAVVSTNFRKVIGETITGISLWWSNGTDPNGTLTGTAGDICLNGATNKPAYCTGTTVWVNFV